MDPENHHDHLYANQSDLTRAIETALKLSQRADLGELPRPAQVEASEDERLGRKLLSEAWDSEGDDSAGWAETFCRKARELIAPKVDREGLANELARTIHIVDNNNLSSEVLAVEMAEAAIAYMGARPVEGGAWKASFDQMVKYRDHEKDNARCWEREATEQRARAERAEADFERSKAMNNDWARITEELCSSGTRGRYEEYDVSAGTSAIDTAIRILREQSDDLKETRREAAEFAKQNRHMSTRSRELIADVERLTHELAEARRQPAQGGLPKVGDYIQPYEGDKPRRVLGHALWIKGRDGEPEFHRAQFEGKTWRRVPQPKPAVATKEKP